jgi:hypothetical protein
MEVWDDLSLMGILYVDDHAYKMLGMMYCDSPPQISWSNDEAESENLVHY